MSAGSIAAAYDAWAAQYDTNENATRDLDAAVVRAQSWDLAGATVLELGCGTGKNTLWFAQQAAAVTAIDFSPKMIAMARDRVRLPNVRFIEHDVLEPWPVDDGAVDVISCNLVLEHIADLHVVFERARRALRAGGRLFVCELHPYRQLRGGQAQFAGADGAVTHVPAFRHDVADFVMAGIGAGLRVVTMAEWRDPGTSADAIPRLLALTFAG